MVVLTIVIGIISAIISGTVTWWKERTAIDECHRYTIGYATRAPGKTLYYRYSVKGRNFTGSWGQKARSWKDYWKGDFVAKNYLYQRFLIQYSCKQPEINRIDWSHSIPESVENAPYDGWETLPVGFPKTKF